MTARQMKFGTEYRNLLFEKIDTGEIDLRKEQILKSKLIYKEVDGALRYIIASRVLDKLPQSVKDELESIWIRLSK